jgi:hypothetical protein
MNSIPRLFIPISTAYLSEEERSERGRMSDLAWSLRRSSICTYGSWDTIGYCNTRAVARGAGGTR